MAQDTHVAVDTSASQHPNEAHTGQRLGAFLCWAVVFADIGTSVYYVPGILYGQVGKLAGLFVTLTLVAFLLLTLKYAEVSVRFPEGGGVVTVSARALNPWAGAVGGMFILVDYFLTSAISSLSGVQYFTTLFPRVASDLLLTVGITLIILVLLGILNWWGIKESASVSAVIAVAAFISDMAILITLFATVPLQKLLSVAHKAFFSGHVSGVTLLTGFAGAFLAFSGLESISQLSPVMRTPRRKTVTLALAFVVITVGITSPLLTIFSTTLLDAAHTDPNVFISALGQHVGGTPLQIFTIITASVLLVFASNTAIIGAYHVFLALSRMGFFPRAIERQNKWRGTPYISIILATGIPMLVLAAVRGNITILGDMYAFGLLGAFSLTCISLDVLRWRERHGIATPGHHEEEAEGTSALGVRLATLPEPIRAVVELARKLWPDTKYYLGFLTTLLICIAWATNLVSKPLATEFGGGLTILGVGISVVHYRYQRRKGTPRVFPMHVLRPIPGSSLVVLSWDSPHNLSVARAAAESADGHPLVFLYLSRRLPREVRPLQFNDPYLFDEDAQRTFSAAASLCDREHIPATYIYRIGGPAAAADVWRVIRPNEIIAEASLAKTLSKGVSPEYVRFQQIDGIRVAHYVKRRVSELDTPGKVATVGPGNKDGTTRNTVQATGTGEAQRRNGTTSAPAVNGQGAAPTQPDTNTAAADTSTAQEPTAGTNGKGNEQITRYVWQGTRLVKKEDVNKQEEQEEQG